MGTVRVEHCPDCGQMIGEGMLYQHRQKAHVAPVLIHGRDCPKVAHAGAGYLHAEDHDGPYDVDGVPYCGRCHGWMGTQPRAEVGK